MQVLYDYFLKSFVDGVLDYTQWRNRRFHKFLVPNREKWGKDKREKKEENVEEMKKNGQGKEENGKKW